MVTCYCWQRQQSSSVNTVNAISATLALNKRASILFIRREKWWDLYGLQVPEHRTYPTEVQSCTEQDPLPTEVRKAFSSTGSKLKSGTTKLVEQSRGPIMFRVLGAKVNQPGLKKFVPLCNSTERRCVPPWLKSTAIKFRQTYSLAPFLLLSIAWANQTSETTEKSCRFQSRLFLELPNPERNIISPMFLISLETKHRSTFLMPHSTEQ